MIDTQVTPAVSELRRMVRQALVPIAAEDPHEVWTALAAPFVEFCLPATAGGLGFGPIELCVVFEELGARHCAAGLMHGALLSLRLGDNTSDVADALRSSTPPDGASLRSVLRTGSVPSGGISLPGGQLALDRRVDTALALDRVMAAAYLAGLAHRGLDLSRRRAATRVLGGRPLIERQSVAHRVAEAAVASEVARVEVHQAAHNHVGHLGLTALATAIEAAIANAHTAVQLYGAAGTSLPEVTSLYRDAYAAARAWGTPSSLWHEAALQRYAPGGSS